jgi:hypothetical protein
LAVVTVSSEPFREPERYAIATAIEEALIDAGLLADERLVERKRHVMLAGMNGYSVLILSASRDIHSSLGTTASVRYEKVAGIVERVRPGPPR